LQGSGYLPQIRIDGVTNNNLVIRPTCVFTASTQSFSIRNTSRIPVHFEVSLQFNLSWQWHIPAYFSQLVSILPVRGRLEPNATAPSTVKFSPKTTKKLLMKISCFFSDSIARAS
jgi:hypothetical protein